MLQRLPIILANGDRESVVGEAGWLPHNEDRPKFGLFRLQRELLPADGYIRRFQPLDVTIQRERVTIIPPNPEEPKFVKCVKVV